MRIKNKKSFSHLILLSCLCDCYAARNDACRMAVVSVCLIDVCLSSALSQYLVIKL